MSLNRNNFWLGRELEEAHAENKRMIAQAALELRATRGQRLLRRLFQPELTVGDEVFGEARVDIKSSPADRTNLPSNHPHAYVLTGYFPLGEIEFLGKADAALVIGGNFRGVGEGGYNGLPQWFDPSVANPELCIRDQASGTKTYRQIARFQKDWLNPAEGYTGFTMPRDEDPQEEALRIGPPVELATLLKYNAVVEIFEHAAAEAGIDVPGL